MKPMKRFIALFMVMCVAVGFTMAGDIQSNGTGGGVWSATATWAGGVVPGSSDNVTIVGTDVVTLDAGASVTNFTVNSGATMDAATFTLSISGTFTLPANATFRQGGTVSSVPGATRSFDNASLYVYYGSQTGISGYFNFGNLTWSSSSNATPSSGLTVNGNLTVTSGKLRAVTSSGGTRTHTVLGNVILSGTGGLTGENGGAGIGTWNITGNVTMSGTSLLLTLESSGASGPGTFNIGGDLTIGTGCNVRYGSNAACTGVGTINVKGNLTNNGTIATNLGTGNFFINFKGAGTQTVSGSGTWGALTNLYDTVATGATVVMGTAYTWGSLTSPAAGVFVVNGTLDMQGTSILQGVQGFTVASGGTVKIADPNGLTSTAATGNIQSTGARTYSTSGNYLYDGSAAQVTGDQLPATVNDLTINNSAGVTITQATAVNGTFQTNAGTITAGNLTLNGIARLNAGGYMDSAPNYGSSSTLVYATGGTYGRFNEWSSTSGAGYPANVQVTNSTTLNYPNGSTVGRSISGSLTIDAGSALYMDYGSPGMNTPLTVAGNVTLAGAISLGDAIGGDLNLGGNWTNNSGTFNANNRAVQFNGSSAQSIGGSTSTTFPYLTINNAAGVSLLLSETVSNTLNLTSGVVTTGAQTLTLNTGGTVNRTTGYVDGNFTKGIGTGNPSVTFEIGSGPNYAPVTAAFTGISTGGTLTAKTTSGEHPNIATSGLDSTKSLNRYYTLTNSGISPTNYNLTMNWAPADTDVAAYTSGFEVRKYDSGTWTEPLVTNQTATSIEATGLTSFSDFAVGDTALPPSAAPTVTSPIAEGSTSVSGTSTEADGTVIDVFVGGSSVGTTTVSTGAWTKTGLTALVAGQQVKATATASGKSVSPFSNIVTVQAVSTAPVVSAPIGVGATSVSGTSTEADGTVIDVFVDALSVGTTTVASGAWTKSGLTAFTLGQQVKATATASGKLVSGYSNIVTVTAVLIISSTSPLPDAFAGTLHADTLTAAGGTPPYSGWKVISGSLPSGLNLDEATGVISGTPTVSGTENFTVQVKDAISDSAGKAFSLTVNPGPLHHFAISAVSTPQTAGTPFGIVITAQDAYNNTVTGFAGTVTLTTTAGSISPSTSGSFTAGVRNENVTVTQTGTARTVSVDDGSGHTGTSNTFDVDPGALHHFAIGPVSTATAGTPFSISLTAQDLNNNTVTGFTGTVNLTTNAGVISPTVSSAFVGGLLNQSVTVTLAGTGKTIGVDDGSGHTGTSNTFAVDPGALHHFAIATISSPQFQGIPFNISITAQDLYNNTVIAFASTVSLTISAGSMTPPVSGAFTAGTITQSVTVSTPGTGLTITADDLSGHNGTSNTFTVSAGQVITSAASGDWGTAAIWNPAQVPSIIDSVVIRGTDSVSVTSASTCAGLNVQAGGRLTLSAKLTPTNVTLDGRITVYTDTLKPSGTMAVNGAGVYQHAQNAGRIPTATWNTGSTLLLTGIVGNSPANARQTFYNVIWNCPSQSGSLNLGWHSSTAGVDTTLIINGDITVLSTGAGRWQMSAPPSGSSGAHSVARITINGNINVSGKSTFTSNGTSNGYTDVIITVHGNVTVSDSATQFAISRGSQGGTGTAVWNFLGNLTMGPYTATANSNQVGGRWVFKKAGLQLVTLDTLVNVSGPTSFQFGDGTTATVVDIGNSRLGGTACIQSIKNNARVIIGPSGYIGGGTSSGSANPPNTPSTFAIEAGGTMVIQPDSGIQTGGSSGAVRVTGTRTFSTAANYEYAGTVPQIAGGALPSTVNNFTINNASGVTLDSLTALTVNGTLTLENGALVCPNDTIIVPSGAMVSRTNGHIAGKMMRHIGTGEVSETFDIGDDVNYTPVALAFHNVTNAGDLLASVTAADHPNLSTSNITVGKSVNRFWTLTNNAIVADNYDATFTFVAGDLDAGVDPNAIVAERYDGAWSPLTVGTRTATSTAVSGVTAYGDIALGEHAVYTLTINTVGSGTVTKNPDQPDYQYNTSVQLTATPLDLSWKFSGWSGDTISTENPLTIIVDNSKNITATFVRDSAYMVAYRTFSHRAIGFDVDNKGKQKKFVALKPDKDQFEIKLRVDSTNITDLHVDFGASIDTFMTFRTHPPSTASTIDVRLKKWDFVFHQPLTTGDTVQIFGYAWTKKDVKVSGYWWTRSGAMVGKKLRTYVLANSILRLPMPNRINALALTLNSALPGSFGTSGIIVGRNEKTPMDSSKYYGWFQTTKYGDVLKTLNEKTVGQPVSGAARPFDFYTKDGKPMKGQKKSMPPSLETNSLLANMIALKVNIVGSDMGILPPGLGDLLYEAGESGPFDGMSLREIAQLGDSMVMGWLKDSVDSRNKPIKLHKFDYTFDFRALDSVIALIDSAFEGPLDTTSFYDALAFTGTKSLVEVPFLRANPSVVRPKVTPPSSIAEFDLPMAYKVYQNYPNPFNPTTTIEFDLPATSVVTLKVYNILGQEVANLFDNIQMDEGTQVVPFNAGKLATGVYFYRLTAQPLDGDQEDGVTEGFTKVMKMMLMK